MNKNFKINLSFLWIMNVMMNMKGYEYVAVVEDDMKAQPDFYVHHLVLSRYAMARPDIAAVMTTTAGDYYDCSGLLLKHLRAQFDVCSVAARLATRVCQASHNQASLGPTVPRTGCNGFLLSSGCGRGEYYRVAHSPGPIPNETPIS